MRDGQRYDRPPPLKPHYRAPPSPPESLFRGRPSDGWGREGDGGRAPGRAREVAMATCSGCCSGPPPPPSAPPPPRSLAGPSPGPPSICRKRRGPGADGALSPVVLQATPSLPKPRRTPGPPDAASGADTLPFSVFTAPSEGRPSQPCSRDGSEVSYPSTPRFSDAGSSATDVMRRLELLEQQLNEERMKRRETERRVLELLEKSKGGVGGSPEGPARPAGPASRRRRRCNLLAESRGGPADTKRLLNMYY